MKVPNIITSKDLSYIEDMFNWNFTASKKALSHSGNVEMSDISNKLCEVAKMHALICEKLVSILEEGGK